MRFSSGAKRAPRIGRRRDDQMGLRLTCRSLPARARSVEDGAGGALRPVLPSWLRPLAPVRGSFALGAGVVAAALLLISPVTGAGDRPVSAPVKAVHEHRRKVALHSGVGSSGVART